MKVLETDRMVLRWLTLEDGEFIYELLNEPAWKRFIGDRHIDSLGAALLYIESGPMASYREHGFGLFGMEDKAGGALVGLCGLLKRDYLDDVDLGFAVLSRFEGQGLAYEAASATLKYAREKLGLQRVVAIVSLDNERSARLLERLGLHYVSMVSSSDDAEELRLFAVDLSRLDAEGVDPASSHARNGG